jgi:carbon storage regulator CsrA
MLVIGRQIDERTIITVPPSATPTRIVVTVTGGTGVKLGFDAPREVSVFREELQHRIDGGEPAPVRTAKT